MNERKTGFVLVGQTPPPFHGQAVAMDILMRHDWGELECERVPIRYSEELKAVGKFQLSKFKELFRVIRATLDASKKFEKPILYYLPASPDWIPLVRDALFLLAVRGAFRGTIYHFHAGGVPEFFEDKPLVSSLLKRIYGKPLVAVEIADVGLSEAEFFEAQKRSLVKNGLKVGLEARAPRVREDSEKKFSGLFLGTLCQEKGILDVLRTLKILASRGVSLEMRFAGGWASDEEEQKFNKEVEALGVQEMVNLVGPKYGDEKWSEIQSADFFFFPSQFRYENFPLVLIEALGLGIPIVSTKWRGIPEIVEDEVTGLLQEVGDHEGFADSIERLATDLDLWNRIHQAQVKRYAERFTEECYCDAMAAVFRDAESLV